MNYSHIKLLIKEGDYSVKFRCYLKAFESLSAQLVAGQPTLATLEADLAPKSVQLLQIRLTQPKEQQLLTLGQLS